MIACLSSGSRSLALACLLLFAASEVEFHYASPSVAEIVTFDDGNSHFCNSHQHFSDDCIIHQKQQVFYSGVSSVSFGEKSNLVCEELEQVIWQPPRL